jgi:hypothetical protein
MSWDVYLQNPISKETLKIGHHDMTGGTYIAGGTDEAWLNVTYNYGGILLRALGCPFRELNGRLASDTIPLLEEGISKLSDEVDGDYWKSTEGNVKKVLRQLLFMALKRPDGYWRVE